MPYPPRVLYIEAAEELKRHPGLAFTLIRNGFFMDYLGLPFAETHLHPLYFVLDLVGLQAAIPGDGTAHAVFTHTRDVGKYIAELLKLPGEQWPRECAINGERISLEDVVRVAENVTGEFVSAYYFGHVAVSLPLYPFLDHSNMRSTCRQVLSSVPRLDRRVAKWHHYRAPFKQGMLWLLPRW